MSLISEWLLQKERNDKDGIEVKWVTLINSHVHLDNEKLIGDFGTLWLILLRIV